MKYIITKIIIIRFFFLLSNISFGCVKEAINEARFFYIICYDRHVLL